MDILSEHFWTDENDYVFGIFLFACDGQLAGIDVYSLSSPHIPYSLPQTHLLSPIPYKG